MSSAVIFVLFGGLILYFMANKRKGIARLKSNYDDALTGSDKRAALAAGRAYYSALRKGKLTIYDEQAITNDISTMR